MTPVGRGAREQVWVVVFLAFVLPLGLTLSQQYQGPLLPLLGSSVVVASIAIVFGRFPVDASILTLVTIIVHDIWRLAYGDPSIRALVTVWIALVVGLAGWGLVEHSCWSGSNRLPAAASKEDAP